MNRICLTSWPALAHYMTNWAPDDVRRVLKGLSITAWSLGRFAELQQRKWTPQEMVDKVSSYVDRDIKNVTVTDGEKTYRLNESAILRLWTSTQEETDDYCAHMLQELIQKEVPNYTPYTVASIASSVQLQAEADFDEFAPEWRQL